ncbi:hypothetical protein [Glutamicibacter ardleyensis]|uniref:hypothetical protein n=1 Tax=Glutamicibacter ardleyensis TaxID=225894 RepID=UPI003FD0E6D2
MKSAEGFECQIPSDTAVKIDVLHCVARPSNGWEISGFILDLFIAIGTVGATVAAIFFGYQAWRNEQAAEAKSDMLRLEELRKQNENERRRNQENQFFQVVNMMRSMVQEFPYGAQENQLWFQSQYSSYIRFLGEDTENKELVSAAQSVLQLFGKINNAYSAATHPNAEMYVGTAWAEDDEVIGFKALLTMLSAQFETSLQHWHRTGKQRNNAEEGLVFLHDTVEERFNELEEKSRL